MTEPFKILIKGNTPEELLENLTKLSHKFQSRLTLSDVAVQPTKTEIVTEVSEAVAKQNEVFENVPFIPATSMTPPSLANYHDKAAALPAEIDSRGFPWDERIHAATKAKNKDGSWRYRRGIEDAEIASVEATIKHARVHSQGVQTLPANPGQSGSAQAGSGFPPVATPTQQPYIPPPVGQTVPLAAPIAAPVRGTVPGVQQSAAHQLGADAGPLAALIPQQMPVHTPPPQPAGPAPLPLAFDFNSFTEHFATIAVNLTNTGKINRDYIDSIEKYFKLPQFVDLVKPEFEDARKQIFANWSQTGLIARVG